MDSSDSSVLSIICRALRRWYLRHLIHSLFRGKPAPMNPWGGNSLEWHTASPPPHDNFATTPVAEDPYDYSRLVEDRANGSFTSRTYEGAEVR